MGMIPSCGLANIANAKAFAEAMDHLDCVILAFSHFILFSQLPPQLKDKKPASSRGWGMVGIKKWEMVPVQIGKFKNPHFTIQKD